MSKTATCTERCTHGTPPRFYAPGDVLVYNEKECPPHFKPKTAMPESAAPVADEKGTVLSDALPPKQTAAEIEAAGTASKPCTVKELAKTLDVDVQLVKDASGNTRQDVKLTSDEVDQVTAAVKKSETGNVKSDGDEVPPEEPATEQE